MPFNRSDPNSTASEVRRRLAPWPSLCWPGVFRPSRHWPSICAICRSWGTSRVCSACVDRFAAPVLRCPRCGLQMPGEPGPGSSRRCGACVTDPPPFVRTVAAVDYGHPWDDLIGHFKFHGALDLAPALAARMLAAWVHSGAASPGLLLPVPLSDARLRERGYNQAAALARILARTMRCERDPGLLLRVKDTPHQLAFPPAQRAGNVRHAFAVEPRSCHRLRGRSVTLVDDVMTTGATAAEIARTLLQAGASEVTIWVVARTPRPGSA